VSADETITGDEFVGSTDEDLLLEEDDRRRRHRRRELAGFAALALGLAIAIWWILTNTVIVPDVVGLDKGEATIRLTVADLQVGDVATVRSTRYRLGEVASQGPVAGRRALRGTEVDLDVARQVSPVTDDPSVVASATQVYESYSTTEWDPWKSRTNYQPAPRVYSKDYPGDVVPMVQALSKKKAVKALKAAGYKVKVRYGSTPSGPGPGKVFFQYPAAFTSEKRGKRVEIWVSTGGPDTGKVSPIPREAQ
jgi:beta-lactam-binding protein with PASTA domain